MPFNSKRTRGPPPSMTLAPMATSNDPTLRHSKDLGAGIENKAKSGFCCALFIDLCCHNMIAIEGDFIVFRPNKKASANRGFCYTQSQKRIRVRDSLQVRICQARFQQYHQIWWSLRHCRPIPQLGQHLLWCLATLASIRKLLVLQQSM